MTISAAVNAVRMVTSRDVDAVERVLGADPVANCFVAARVSGGGLDPWRLGGELLGYYDDDQLVSLLYAGANLVPVGTTACGSSRVRGPAASRRTALLVLRGSGRRGPRPVAAARAGLGTGPRGPP